MELDSWAPLVGQGGGLGFFYRNNGTQLAHLASNFKTSSVFLVRLK